MKQVFPLKWNHKNTLRRSREMNSTQLQIRHTRYRRRFRIPVKTARGIAETRKGILVSIENSNGTHAYGEIAPWDGFGCETLDQAEKILREISAGSFPAQKFPEILARAKNFPCTRHALASALFFLENPEKLKAPEPPNDRICKLILRRNPDDSPETLFEQIRLSRREDFRTFKIKIGLAPLDDEMRFCEKMLTLTAENLPDIRIRFDANGAWNTPSVLEKIAPLNTFPQLEFIEQPLAATPENDTAICALPPERAAKIALDESLREPWEMPAGTQVIAVVKPLLIGDFFRLREWLSSENAPRFVISSVFETECGRCILRELAAFTKNNPRALAHGIAPVLWDNGETNER